MMHMMCKCQCDRDVSECLLLANSSSSLYFVHVIMLQFNITKVGSWNQYTFLTLLSEHHPVSVKVIARNRQNAKDRLLASPLSYSFSDLCHNVGVQVASCVLIQHTSSFNGRAMILSRTTTGVSRVALLQTVLTQRSGQFYFPVKVTRIVETA